MPKLIQSSLSGGEISPAVAARVDIAKYKSSVASAENMFCRVHGGMENRAGFKYVARCKDSTTDVRLIPFQFNTEQTYVLEFGNLYMRVIKDAGQVNYIDDGVLVSATKANPCRITVSIPVSTTGFLDATEVRFTGVGGMTELNNKSFRVNVISNVSYADGHTVSTIDLKDLDGVNLNSSAFGTFTSGGLVTSPFELVTPYPTSVLRDIKYVQSADTMTLTHPLYAPKDLTRTDHDVWTISDIVFYPETSFPTSVAITVSTTGSTTVQYAVTAVNVETSEESLRGVRTYAPATKTITNATSDDPCVITTLAAHGLVVGDEIDINGVSGMIELNDRRYRVGGVPTTTTIELSDTSLSNVDATGYTDYSNFGRVEAAFVKVTNSALETNNIITWASTPNAGSYNIYKDVNGLFGFIGTTELTTFTDKNIKPDTEDTPPRIRNPFIGTNNYPSTVGYYQQRRVFANTNNHPQRIFMSQTANISNMASSSPTKDDDAIIITIASMQVNEVRHLVPLADMVVLTSGGEWLLNGAADAALTAATVQVTPQTYYGANELQPIVSGANVIFAENGSIIRDLGYRYETDSYSGNDISILARHLFDNKTLQDWCYRQSPDSLIYVIRDDGVMLTLTYLKEQEVFGWARTTTRGDFISCTSVAEGNSDAFYVVVERTIDGDTVKYIERQDDRAFVDLEDAFFVDAGLSYDTPVTVSGYTQANPVVITATAHGFSNGDTVDISDVQQVDATTNQGHSLCTDICGNGFTVASVATNTFELKSNGVNVNGTAFSAYQSGGKVRKQVTVLSGLFHLEGESVVGSANGNVVGPLTVTGGSVTLPNAASRIHLGLGYTAELQTLRINVPASTGETIQGKDKKLSRITIRTERCMGMQVGPSDDAMREVKFGLPARFGQPRVLFDGDKDTTLKPNWSKEGQMLIRQTDPMPLTVLAIIPDAILGGN
jgi:hypothetical protein